MTTETILTDDMSLIDQLREYAADNGYSHNDYADTMTAAADALERHQQAVLQSPEVQALRKDAERIRALAREFDRARRGSGDSYMPIWNALCESIGSDDDGDEMLAAITAAMEQQI